MGARAGAKAVVLVEQDQESRKRLTTARKQACGQLTRETKEGMEVTEEVTTDGITMRITKAGLTPNLTTLRAVGMMFPLTRVCYTKPRYFQIRYL